MKEQAKAEVTLVAQISFLQKQLQREQLKNAWLIKETDIQRKIICQQKTLQSSHQTKPTCILGHIRCSIDHLKYNYFRPSSKTRKRPPAAVEKEKKGMSLCHIGKTTLLKLTKKIDKLQSSYGVPPALRSNL